MLERNNKLLYLIVMSGISATLLTLGTTAYKLFGLHIPYYQDSSYKIDMDSPEAQIIKDSKIIFINKCSIMYYKLLDYLNIFLWELMINVNLMGDKFYFSYG